MSEVSRFCQFELLLISGAELRTGNVQLDPPHINQIVDLYLTADPRTTIPEDGSIEILFPEEQLTLPLQQEDCVLQQPPFIVSAVCVFSRLESNQIKLSASGFDQRISTFFQLKIPGYLSPRSTAPTSSFVLKTLNSDGRVLDQQSKGLSARATQFNEIRTTQFDSSSPVVGAKMQTLQVSFVTLDILLPGDQIELILPKWNTASRFPDPIINYREPVVCTGILNTKETFECVLQKSGTKDTIVLPDSLLAEKETEDGALVGIGVGQTVAFQVSYIINPLSTAPVPGFGIKTLDKRGGTIAQGSGQFEVYIPAQIADDNPEVVSLAVTQTLIYEESEFFIEVQLPVPLEQGCQIELFIPEPLRIGPELTTVEVGGQFGEFREAIFTIDASRNMIKIVNACASYRQNVAPATFNVKNLTNPGYVVSSESFKFEFSDIDGNAIAQTSGGIVYTTTPGRIFAQDLQWYASDYLISAPSEITFSLQPEHHTLTENVMIAITLPPEDFEELPQPCVMEYYNKLIDPATFDCQSNVETNTLELRKVLRQDYKFSEESIIEFSIRDIIMPTSSRPTGAYKLEFLTWVERYQQYMLVDTGIVYDKLRGIPGVLYQVEVKPRLNQTYIEDTFDFSFMAAHKILQRGQIEIVIPKELRFTDDAACLNFSQGFSPDTVCSFDQDTNVLMISEAFPDEDHTEIQMPIQIEVHGIFTQRTVKPTSAFRFRTFDAWGYEIDTHRTYKLVAMNSVLNVDLLQIRQESDVVGALTAYHILLRSQYPLYNGDIIYIEAPPQAAQNLAYTYRNCSGSEDQSYISQSLHCVLIGLDGIQINLNLEPQYTQIPAQAQFGFKLSLLQNPESTKPSEPFYLNIKDYQSNLVTEITTDEQLLSKFVMYSTQPAPLIFATVKNEPRFPRYDTLITLSTVIKHPLPTNGQLVVGVPRQLDISEKIGLSCWVSTNPSRDSACVFDQTTYTFEIFDVNPSLVRGGNTIEIELRGFVNSDVADAQDPFTLITRTSEGFLIDEWQDRQSVSSSCNYPCLQCSENDPSECRKCNTEADSPDKGLLFNLYYDNTCISSCPSNFYPSNNLCLQCDPNCLECSGSSKKCLKCHPGSYLLGNVCQEVCPATHHGIDETGTCEVCERPCKTCSGSLTNCTSCDTDHPQYLFFQNLCYEECPAEISVFDRSQCVACDENCKTCEDSTLNCTSCNNNQYLDMRTLKCLDICPAEISVASFFPSTVQNPVKQELTCEMCNENCLTCEAEDVSICTECREGLKLIERTKECVDTCPVGTADVWIPLTEDIICAECAPGCTECIYSRETCTVCEPSKKFFDYSCVDQCPEGFEIVSEQMPTCVRIGQVCDFGYAFNSTGQCVLELAHCEPGYTLNASDDKCIPEPGFHAPFVFIFAAIGWAIFILRKKNKIHFDRETIVSQLLIGLAVIQQIGYIVLLILAFQMGYRFLSYLHLAGMFALFFLNLAFLLTFTLLVDDLPFSHWRQKYLNESRAILAVSTLFNFKLGRLLYCQLRSRPWYNAASESKFETFIRPMFVFSMISMIQACPIMMVNIYTIWLIRWGYELKTLSMESIVLCIVILALEIYEFILHKQREPSLLKVRDFFGKRTKRVGMLKVMSGFEDDEQGPDGNINESQIRLSNVERSKRSEFLPHRDRNQVSVAVDTTSEFNSQPRSNIYNELHSQDDSHLKSLNGMIHKLDESRRIRAINSELDDMDVDTGKEYIDEAYRKKLLITSAKEKQKLFREKRQKFEKHRGDRNEASQALNELPEMVTEEAQEKELDLVISTRKKKVHFEPTKPSITQLNFLALNRQLNASNEHENQSLSGHGSIKTGGNTLEAASPIKLIEGGSSRRHKEENSIESRSNRSSSQIRQQSTKRLSLKKFESEQKTSILKRPLSYLEKLQAGDEEQFKADKRDYDYFYDIFKKEFDQKAKEGRLVPNGRLNQSFDGDVLREMYDDFGVASDFDSELSWISYPPNKGFLREYYENNPRKQAEHELFQQKIKITFQYSNIYTESYVPEKPPKLDLKPNRKTQTMIDDLEEANRVDYDPFESEETIIEESSEALSCIDSEVCDNIMQGMYKGCSEDSSEANSEVLEPSIDDNESYALDSDDSEEKKDKKTKKRKRVTVREQSVHVPETGFYEREGFNGRGTSKNIDLTGKLGSVYDAQGHLVYDKDYISQESIESKQSSRRQGTVTPSEHLAMSSKRSKTAEDKSGLSSKKSRRDKNSIPEDTVDELGQEGIENFNQLSNEEQLEIVARNEYQKQIRSGGEKSSKGDNSSAANIDKETNEGGITSGLELSNHKLKVDEQQSNTRAHKFLDNQWESEMSNSQHAYKFGKGALGGTVYQGSGDEKSEMQRFRNMNQTEIIRDEYYNGDVQNWSDRGSRQSKPRRSHPLSERENPDGYTFRADGVNARKQSGPQPFTALGVTSKPFKARRNKAKDAQLLADQRRAKVSLASDRMRHLENIYLKAGISSTKNHPSMMYRNGPPRADSVAEETTQVFRRHSRQPPTNVQTTSKLASRKDNGARLRKQNFVEDGQNIMRFQQATPLLNTNQPYARVNRSSLTSGAFDKHSLPQSSQKVHRRDLNLDNSASETDFQILNQLKGNFGDVQSYQESREESPGRIITASQIEKQSSVPQVQTDKLGLPKGADRHETNLVATSLNNFGNQSNDFELKRRSTETRTLFNGMRNMLEKISKNDGQGKREN